MVLIPVEICRGIESAAELAHLLLGNQAAEILSGVAGEDHIARTKHPERMGVVAGRY